MSKRRNENGRGVGVAVAILAAIGCGAGPPVTPGAGPDGGAREADVLERFVVPGQGSAAPVPDDPELRRGFEAWAVLCAPCHGQTGKGDGAVADLLTSDPGDLTDPDALVFTTDRERIQVIAEGIEGSPMIGWKAVLSAAEIEALNGYLRSLLESGSEGDRTP
jgi:mono/diheme cytochrome c family protein